MLVVPPAEGRCSQGLDFGSEYLVARDMRQMYAIPKRLLDVV